MSVPMSVRGLKKIVLTLDNGMKISFKAYVTASFSAPTPERIDVSTYEGKEFIYGLTDPATFSLNAKVVGPFKFGKK